MYHFDKKFQKTGDEIYQYLFQRMANTTKSVLSYRLHYNLGLQLFSMLMPPNMLY